MRLARWLCLTLIVVLITPMAQARSPQGSAESQPADTAEAEQPAAPSTPSEPALPTPPSPETPASPPTQATPAEPPSAKRTRRRSAGAIVVADDAGARTHAKTLARAVYGDAKLRPTIDESMAHVLVGGAAAADDATETEVAAVVKALEAASSDAVRRPLMASVGTTLSAQLVVIVAVGAGGPTARVLRVADEQFVAVTLAAAPEPTARSGYQWRDAVGILHSLVKGPPPGPRSTPAPSAVEAATADGADDSDWDLLTSPWFWGGLGVVVAVGVTVLILSQTTLNEPDLVMLKGRVGP